MSTKMDWMYKDSTKVVDDEEYLLGRRIDKAVDKEVASSKVSIPSSIFELAGSSNLIDAARKIKEDPLEAIREKEIEMRKQLLKNPVQMKKLRKMLEAQNKQNALSKEKKKKAKKKKKKKKKKSSSSDDEDIDQLLTEKLTKLVKQHAMQKVMEECRNKRKTNKKESESDSDSQSSSEDSSSASDSEDQRKRKKKKLKKPEKSPHEESAHQSSKYSRERSPKSDVTLNGYGLSVPEGATKARVISKKDNQKGESSKTDHWRKKPREKLSEKEKERRLKEMMENVSWRDKLRENNIKRYKEEDEREKSKNTGDFDHDFSRKELSKAMYTGSVEKRIQSNRHNIQRSNNESFLKR